MLNSESCPSQGLENLGKFLQLENIGKVVSPLEIPFLGIIFLRGVKQRFSDGCNYPELNILFASNLRPNHLLFNMIMGVLQLGNNCTVREFFNETGTW